ncbi:MAG: NtaA/DmoA family FMN-dependent monooxygenase, partial [Alphaproteobacteria bacterium]|nr:NtaA/DmoA family FMN-dependent monooxygenase [Alphaproteobacteria bacterium]
FAANSPSDRPAVFEPVTLYAALSQHTKRIGFVATATTSYEEPFTIARKFASLDHLSGGRAAWNLVTTQYVEDAKNFNRDEHMGREERYERARESLDVVRSLWDSWAEDAFVQDKSTGQYLDPARVRLTNHRGKHFKVKGPLNVSRAPQGQPVVFMAGQSDDGKELAAYGGEGLFGTAAGKQEAQAEFADIKGRMPRYGRPPDALKILPGLSIYVGRTAAEADELYDDLQSLISPALGVTYLSKIVGMDLSKVALDGPLPQRPNAQSLGGTAIGRSVLDMIEREKLTVRQAYERVLPSMAGNMVKGTPAQVADFMEDWFQSEACDGFILSVPVQPRSLKSFVDLLVPELQRRGLRPDDYAGPTLRENMGLARPVDPFSRERAAS